MAAKIRKGDSVIVIAGRDKGRSGEVIEVRRADGRALVRGVNMVKRHSKPRGAQSPGGIVEKEAPLDISNVMIFCDRCNAPVRVGVKTADDGTRNRVCRKCGEAIGND